MIGMGLDSRTIIPVFCLLTFFASEAFAEPPSQLYGKSITISWTNNFMLREVGSTAPFHPSTVQRRMSVYVSTAGRPFVRNAATSRGGSGTVEHVGTGGQSYDNGPRSLQFQGRTLVIYGGHHNSAALQIKIDFDPGFSTCTASAIFGKSTGLGTFTFKSMSTGKTLEAQSVSARDATCSVKDGNVFAD